MAWKFFPIIPFVWYIGDNNIFSFLNFKKSQRFSEFASNFRKNAGLYICAKNFTHMRTRNFCFFQPKVEHFLSFWLNPEGGGGEGGGGSRAVDQFLSVAREENNHHPLLEWEG